MRDGVWREDEQAALRGYGLLSGKPELVVANIGEDDLEGSGAGVERLRVAVAEAGGVTVALSAKLESEIAELPLEERDEMLQSMGLSEPAIGPLARAINKLLGLTTFYTAGEKAVRSWIIREGASAPEAAGVIHTDIEHGFIRAECYHVDELTQLGSEKAIKGSRQAAFGRQTIRAAGRRRRAFSVQRLAVCGLDSCAVIGGATTLLRRLTACARSKSFLLGAPGAPRPPKVCSPCY